MTFKFRRSLEPFVNAKPDGPRRTALKPTGDLLIGYSGGLGSSVLLDLVHRCYVLPEYDRSTAEGGRDHPRKDRVWRKVNVCYVEVCDAFPGMKDNTESIRCAVEQYDGVELISLRVQDAFDPNWWNTTDRSIDLTHFGVNLTSEELLLSSIPAPASPTDALRIYLSSLPTDTARSTALQTLTRLLLYHTAVRRECSHLLLGTSLTSLAVSLISSIAQGGGFHVKEEIQEEWTPNLDIANTTQNEDAKPSRNQRSVRVIRPLRDIGMKECAVWAWWKGVKVVGRESWEWPGSKLGIGRMTKDFIVGLEKDYPSTVSTIVRTCGKLAPKGDVAAQCLLCARPIQQGVQAWKARISIRSLNASDTKVTAPLLESLRPHLCYTCHTTLTSRSPRTSQDSPTAVPLPMWTIAQSRLWNQSTKAVDADDETELFVERRVNQDEMREVVKEFLLDD
ncbi:unnamed protein product [Somion occarium]